MTACRFDFFFFHLFPWSGGQGIRLGIRGLELKPQHLLVTFAPWSHQTTNIFTLCAALMISFVRYIFKDFKKNLLGNE